MYHLKTIFSFFVVFIVNNCESYKEQRVGRIDRIEECGKTDNATMRLIGVRIDNPPHKNSVLNVKFELQRVMRKIPDMEVHIIRCNNKEALDTCVPFKVIKPYTTCGLIINKSAPWAPVVNLVKPPIQCPFQPGVFDLSNATVNSDIFNLLPFGSDYWKVKFLFIEDVDFIAICCDFHIVPDILN